MVEKNEISTRLEQFPIMFFAVIMGFGGFSVAYEKLHLALDISHILFEVLRYATLILFAIITISYALKIVKYPKEVKKELNHPIRLNFFATFPISLFLLSILFRDIYPLYISFFSVALVLQTYITLHIVSFWIKNNMLINHSNPAWFIPMVGNLIVPLASAENGEFLWYYFSVGLFFWFVLFTIIIYRIVFHDQLAQKYMPTLFIIIAPPAIGFLDYTKLVGEFDVFALVLFNLMLFFVFLIFFMYKSFLKLKFFLSWWAFTFPTAAASIALVKAYELSQEKFFLYFSVFLFVCLFVIMIIVGYHTIKGIFKKEICVIE